MPLLRIRVIRFLPREHGHASTLTSLDVLPEPDVQIQEQYASLLDEVWKCEARERRTDEQERTFG